MWNHKTGLNQYLLVSSFVNDSKDVVECCVCLVLSQLELVPLNHVSQFIKLFLCFIFLESNVDHMVSCDVTSCHR